MRGCKIDLNNKNAVYRQSIRTCSANSMAVVNQTNIDHYIDKKSASKWAINICWSAHKSWSIGQPIQFIILWPIRNVSIHTFSTITINLSTGFSSRVAYHHRNNSAFGENTHSTEHKQRNDALTTDSKNVDCPKGIRGSRTNNTQMWLMIR